MILHEKVRWLAFCNAVKSLQRSTRCLHHDPGLQCNATRWGGSDWAICDQRWVLPKQRSEQRCQCGTRQHNIRAGAHNINGEAPEMDERNGSYLLQIPRCVCAWYGHQPQSLNIIVSSQTNALALQLHHIFIRFNPSPLRYAPQIPLND